MKPQRIVSTLTVWGIDHAFRLGDPLLPGEDAPFEENWLKSNNKKVTNKGIIWVDPTSSFFILELSLQVLKMLLTWSQICLSPRRWNWTISSFQQTQWKFKRLGQLWKTWHHCQLQLQWNQIKQGILQKHLEYLTLKHTLPTIQFSCLTNKGIFQAGRVSAFPDVSSPGKKSFCLWKEFFFIKKP